MLQSINSDIVDATLVYFSYPFVIPSSSYYTVYPYRYAHKQQSRTL